MLWEQPLQYASLSDIGFRRQNNQDSYSVLLSQDQAEWERRGHLFLVADGMGGHAVGELASKMAADAIPHTFHKLPDENPGAALKAAIEQANAAIFGRGSQISDFERMGTTCSTLILGPYGAYIGHIGDSRVYRIRHHRIDQLSRDHSLIWEMIEQRKVKPQDAEQLVPKNVITRCLGPEEHALVDLEGPFPVETGDVYLLCSDGLTGLLSDSEIGMIASELPPPEACRMLVNLANLRGGLDNTTILIVKVGDPPPGTQALPVFQPGKTDHSPAAKFLGISGLVAGGIMAGLLCLIPGAHLAGYLLAGVLVVVTIIWITLARREPAPQPATRPDTPSTVLWRPYRTAEAKINREVLDKLMRMESELQRAAHDESWEIEWQQHGECLNRLQLALKERRIGKALRELTRAYDCLMVGVHQQRRQIHRDAKWGKTNSPVTKSDETTAGDHSAENGIHHD